ncbi:MAG TPA: hypothetical protein VGC77_06810 [Rhodopseudomonas sp.]
MSYHVRSAAAVVLAFLAIIGMAAAWVMWFVALPLVGLVVLIGRTVGVI